MKFDIIYSHIHGIFIEYNQEVEMKIWIEKHNKYIYMEKKKRCE